MRQQQITQHKRFVPYGTHPNPALYAFYLEGEADYRMNLIRFHNESNYKGLEGWASFMLGTLGEIKMGRGRKFEIFRRFFDSEIESLSIHL